MTRYEVELTDEQARSFAAAWSTDVGSRDPLLHCQAAYALVDAIRANPPKPPRMAEPGWGEKVTAACAEYPARRTWVRYSDESTCLISAHLWAGEGGIYRGWDELLDPEPWRAAS